MIFVSWGEDGRIMRKGVWTDSVSTPPSAISSLSAPSRPRVEGGEVAVEVGFQGVVVRLFVLLERPHEAIAEP